MINGRVGVVGAGIAGLTLASRLTETGHSVTVLDKGRGPGGRTSTRRTTVGPFDHGAQYYTVRDPGFQGFLDQYVPTEHRAVWTGRFASWKDGQLLPETSEQARWVGVPGMSALARAIGSRLDVHKGVRVVEIRGTPGDWSLIDAEDSVHGPFDWVVVTTPPEQSSSLLGVRSPISEIAARVTMLPCFALMVLPTDETTLPADGIRLDHPVLGWSAIDGSKPGRFPSNALVLQSNNQWAAAHRDDEQVSVIQALKAAAEQAFAIHLNVVGFQVLHRWLYAKPAQPLGQPCLIDRQARLALAGDWCLSGKVEGAYQSGDACAQALIDRPS